MKQVNPLKTLRDSAGLSVAELADAAGVSSQAVIRAEQGVYASPPPNVLDALWRYAPEDDLHDYGILLADYHNFQRLTRQNHYGLESGGLDESYVFKPNKDHPFVAWRLDSGIEARIQISKKYCVHPALVFKFEAQPYLCSTPPKELIRALLESGYSAKKLAEFEEAFAAFRKERGSKLSPVGVVENE